MQVVDTALMRRDRAFGHIGHPRGIQQRRNAQVVAERFLGQVHVDACTVEHAQVVFPFAAEQAVHHDAQVEAGSEGRRGRVQAAVHIDRRSERSGQHREQRFAQRHQVSLAERRLELTDAEPDLVFEIHVDPRLLEQRPAGFGRIQRQIEGQFIESPARETQNRIRDLETAVRHVVLVVQAELFVVVPVEFSGGLQQHVRLQHEIARLGLKTESFFAPHRDHGAFDVFVRIVVFVRSDFGLLDLGRRLNGRCTQGQ